MLFQIEVLLSWHRIQVRTKTEAAFLIHSLGPPKSNDKPLVKSQSELCFLGTGIESTPAHEGREVERIMICPLLEGFMMISSRSSKNQEQWPA